MARGDAAARRTAMHQDSNLLHFTNRVDELRLVETYLLAAGRLETSAPPILSFYGEGGIGKSWLLQRVKEVAQRDYKLPTAMLTFDRMLNGGTFLNDSALSLYTMREQIGVDAPRFDLAYALYRFKSFGGDRPEFKGQGALSTVFNFCLRVAELGERVVTPWSKLQSWMAEKGLEAFTERLAETKTGRWILTKAGFEDYVRLSELSVEAINGELVDRLARDWDEFLPRRAIDTGTIASTAVIRAVVLLDACEWFDIGFASQPQHRRIADDWLRQLCLRAESVLFILAGQNSLPWTLEPNVLDQRSLDGLARADAEEYLKKRNVRADLYTAILGACREHQRYHSLSLGWCCDIADNNPETDASTFQLKAKDWDLLAERFLRSLLTPGERIAIEKLALNPRFDESAAKWIFREEGVEVSAAWNRLRTYSFVEPARGGWLAMRPHARAAVVKSFGQRDTSELESARRQWLKYWSGRSKDELDDAAELAWTQWWFLEPAAARLDWQKRAEELRNKLQMAEHAWAIEWWSGTGIETRPPETWEDAAALNDIGTGLCRATQGSIDGNLRRAIECYEAALRVRTETALPQSWAATQNNLGAAYYGLPGGDRDANLRRAIECYEAALRVYTETAFPQDWAMTQFNMGLALERLEIATPNGGAHLREALACLERCLRVYTETAFPSDHGDAMEALRRVRKKLGL